MKKLITLAAALTLCAGSAHATETFGIDSIATALPTVDSKTVRELSACLNADVTQVSSRAVRACTKAYRASVPDYGVRSDILTRRGLLRLSSGKVEAATRDFDKAARLSDDNEFANLGLGFAALMQKDYEVARARFTDCADHRSAGPLAAYGLALSLEMSGDRDGAISAYERALDLQPGWTLAADNLSVLKAVG